jgi:DNA polymerase-3 subunit alpha
MNKFTHLHVHSKYSILDGASDIKQMYQKAVDDKMPAIALTDHGNMFGVFKFVAEASKYNPKGAPPVIKPIVGCEFYLVEDRHRKQFTRDDRDMRYHQLLLAKNATGYHNLTKLCSLGYMEGLYSKYPRIDKELILKYKEGLIATTCCLAAEVPRAIINKGEAEAEELFKWWFDLFGEDYYVELQRHGIPEQEQVNKVLLKFAAKYGVKTIATNDSHYVEQDFYEAHDILLCVNTAEKRSTPTSKDYSDDESAGRGTRFAFYNDQFYFKTTAEMSQLFADIPEAIDNTNEIVGKVELLNLERDIMLPYFALPQGYTDQFAYLHDITYQGARQRYGELTPEVEERIKFELSVINKMGFTGYFLIVADFIRAGREMDVFVGPGRGSAAGSVVAYCIGITSIDPIKYQLLFERFLNPGRHSMPDIDTDFDDVGRQKVIDYVVQKYGRNQVAQIVTFGTMAAKSSIKDVARVLDLKLNDANILAKLVPDAANTRLGDIMKLSFSGSDKARISTMPADDVENIKRLQEIAQQEGTLEAEVIAQAVLLEGSVRSTGIHAAGIIIAPSDITDILPVLTSKESDLLITQFEGKEIEKAGVIKMDFLGLKTLSILKDALKLIKRNYGVDIDINNLPLDDAKTLELYQRGETTGTFQFESANMQKYLRELKPDKFEDLIAMNALYRPGPMDYIPKFIDRKFGREPVSYDLPEMEEYLKETYGITVYQEQVMLLSQKLAGFDKSDADNIRKAMGKKDFATLNKEKSKFLDGCEKNNLDLKICNKVWTDWEAFASYAFNKSHSTCYAFVAFQTAYLKAHFPADYMAAVLTHNLNDIKKITFFIDECKRMGIPVLGPDVNESGFDFMVNNQGEIRFGMGAIKGLGENAVNSIIEEREANGNYTSIFNLVERVNLRTINRRSLEALASAGAFDQFENTHRAQYFYKASVDGASFLETALKYGYDFQAKASGVQQSLFDAADETLPDVEMPECEPWSSIEKLKNEREVIGFYMSGHPLDDYRTEIKAYCPDTISEINAADPNKVADRQYHFAGIITSAKHRTSKQNTGFANFTVEDDQESLSLSLFGEEYLKNKHLLEEEMLVMITGSYRKRYRESAAAEFHVSNIMMLVEVMDQMTKSMSITLPVSSVNDEMTAQLGKALFDNRGPCRVQIILEDVVAGYRLRMWSRFGVKARDFYHKAVQIPGISIELVKK